jgi:copper homeostasis protein
MGGQTVVEVCIDSVESAIAAEEGGAARVELCAALNEGGLTPSAGMIELVRKNIDIKLHVMIRPRPGDFFYSDLEIETMLRDIEVAKRLGADGVVIGVLNRDYTVDGVQVKRLVELARPLSLTFHRAFDEARDQTAAMEEMVRLGIDRILTSGGQASVSAGLSTVKKLVEESNGRIAIMAGSGITMQNVVEIVARTGVKEVHVRSGVSITRPGESRETSLYGLAPAVVDATAVRKLVAVLP